MTVLTPRFASAVEYARSAHALQVRKGSGVPYIYHLLGVASLVIEFGGDEDQAIAGLLHDVLEDCGESHEPSIRAEFGEKVCRIVRACTDGSAEAKAGAVSPEDKKSNWTMRKQRYLTHLGEADQEVLLVSACDKLHNARAIVQDLEHPSIPDGSVFDRFTGGREDTLGYYHSLVVTFTRKDVRVAPVLDKVVGQMHALAGVPARKPLA